METSPQRDEIDLFEIVEGAANFANYAIYINKTLSSSYLNEAKKELSSVKSKSDKVDSSVLQFVLANGNFVDMRERAANVFQISVPTRPKKVSPRSGTIIAFSTLTGALLGVVFCLLQKRFENIPTDVMQDCKSTAENNMAIRFC